MNKKEKKDEKNSIINHSLDSMVNERVQKMTVDVLEINKKINDFKRRLDDFSALIEGDSVKFANQRLLSNKIASIRRMLYASKIGLDRQKLKMYDIDQLVIKEEIIRGMK